MINHLLNSHCFWVDASGGKKWKAVLAYFLLPFNKDQNFPVTKNTSRESSLCSHPNTWQKLVSFLTIIATSTEPSVWLLLSYAYKTVLFLNDLLIKIRFASFLKFYFPILKSLFCCVKQYWKIGVKYQWNMTNH